VLVCALAVGWWVERSRYQPRAILKEYGIIETQLRELGYTMFTDETQATGHFVIRPFANDGP
jgi:hypothetical protein